MPRTSLDYDTRTKTARAKLAVRDDPYYRQLSAGKTFGYIRRADRNGSWLVRERVAGKYTKRVIGQADDYTPADGRDVFTFEQALRFVTMPDASRAVGKMTVADALTRYHDKQAAKSKHAEAYRAVSNLHIVPILGGFRIDRLTKTQIESWQSGLVRITKDVDDKRRSRDTANRILTHLKAALNLAFVDESNGVPSDRAWRTVKPFKKVGRPRSDHDLEATKVMRLVKCAAEVNEPLAHLIECAYLTGARMGELRDANVGDFDAARNTLRVDGKTGPRPITLTNEATAFLRSIVKGRKPGDALLPTLDSARWPIGHFRAMKAAVKRAELPGGRGGVTMYTLRHAHISRAIEAGVPLSLISDNCGTSLLMIQRNYQHVLAQTRRDTIEASGPKLRVIAGGKGKRVA